jgi:hypothetical protein
MREEEQMKRQRLIAWAAAVVLLLVCAGIVFAFSLGNVDGVWSVIDGGGGATGDRWATGNGDSPTHVDTDWWDQTTGYSNSDENQVRYGSDSDFADKSGFGFDGISSLPQTAENVPFLLGEFTHYNNPISADNALGYVDLGTTISTIRCNDNSVPTPDDSMLLTYRFTLDETPNQTPCTYPGTTVCPDRVTITRQTSATETFTCGSTVYTVWILGFIAASDDVDNTCANETYNEANLSSAFITEESRDNYACLWGKVSSYNPTAVEIMAFDAQAGVDSVTVTWETASEVDNLGFNLYRAESEDGPRTKLNEAMIPSQSPGQTAGVAYDYVDAGVTGGATYCYWLEAIDTRFVADSYGPVTVTASEATEPETPTEPELVEPETPTEPVVVEPETPAEPELVEPETPAEPELVDAETPAQPEVVEPTVEPNLDSSVAEAP